MSNNSRRADAAIGVPIMDTRKRFEFEAVFGCPKPIIGMVHLKADGTAAMMARAKREIDLLLSCGVNAVLVENYFGTAEDAEAVLDYLHRERSTTVYGVNMLNDDARAFEASARYAAKFIQLDSVAGHLTPAADDAFAGRLAKWRASADALVLGGVRFKYQPYKSGRPLGEDLRLGMERSDVIVVSGEGTGLPTSMEKIRSFREIIGDFPLIIGAGMTPENCRRNLAETDGAIVGSYFKDMHKDSGDVNELHVRAFMDAVRGVLQ